MSVNKYDKFFLSYDGAEPKANDYTSLSSLPPFPEIASRKHTSGGRPPCRGLPPPSVGRYSPHRFVGKRFHMPINMMNF